MDKAFINAINNRALFTMDLMLIKETGKALRAIIGVDQTVVYAHSRLPKSQLVGYLSKFPTTTETVTLWDTFSVEALNALVQRAAFALPNQFSPAVSSTAPLLRHRTV